MVLDYLRAKQKAAKMSDAEFAAHLGMSTEAWRFWRNGRAKTTLWKLRKAAAAYPELLYPTIVFLGFDATVIPTGGISVPNTPIAPDEKGGVPIRQGT